MKAKSFKELEIWQIGMAIAADTYRLTSDFPEDERFGLISPMRRSAISIPGNTAEGWGRASQAQLANFVRIARGSANELETFCELAVALELANLGDLKTLEAELTNFGKKSYLFIENMSQGIVREEVTAYGIESQILNLDPLTFDPSHLTN